MFPAMMYHIQVTLEESPGKSFLNTSAQKCWETVMDELNQEFSRRQSLGNAISPFLDPQSINGLAMFGFLSPHIIQVIITLLKFVYYRRIFGKKSCL